MKHLLLIAYSICSLIASAQTIPDVGEPYAISSYSNELGELESDTLTTGSESYSQSAPLRIVFYANQADQEGYRTHYEWTIKNTKTVPARSVLQRYDENLDYTFRESGTFEVCLTVAYLDEQVPDDDASLSQAATTEFVFTISIPQSVLDFPNTFTPNGDGNNDVLKAKTGYQSIVSFHATVFNRWGQKLFSWDDLSGGWDGRYNGSVVSDGAYYLVVDAQGADGFHYKLRKAINVLTKGGYDEATE